jgi:alcohol dehydrogenase
MGMKAWRLDSLGGTLRLEDAPIPEPRAGSVVVRIEASALMSYLKAYVEGRLLIYSPPDGPFTPGGNAIGICAYDRTRGLPREGWTAGRDLLAYCRE